VSLKKEENKVLVKICELYGEWGFFFRVTDLKGNFIEDLEFSPTLGAQVFKFNIDSHRDKEYLV